MKDVDEIVRRMSLDEKIALMAGGDAWHISGVPSAGLSSVMITDGPHGLRKQMEGSDNLGQQESVPATCYPPACLMASSWDEDVPYMVGQALGEECIAEDVAVVLGPGVNTKRSPLCGRCFEYYSEDPYLSGRMGASFIRGVERTGIGTSLKHFAANSQERMRMSGNSVVDERALREIYLKEFEIAVKEGHPSTVMCSYNRVDGMFSSVNRWLLTDVLRDEWGFDGLVMSDWGAMSERVDAIRAGLDLEMPGPAGENADKVRAAIEDGTLSMADLDMCVKRIVSLLFKASDVVKRPYDKDAHHEVARRAASSSFVLLENNGILPLKKDANYALIGSLADRIRYQGAGSSRINPTRLDTIRDSFPTFDYAIGYDPETGSTTDELIDEAISTSRGKDASIVVIGLPDSYEAEGFDRRDMDLPQGQVRLVEALLDAGCHVAVLVLAGAPVVLPFSKRVDALLMCYLGGQALGSAVLDVLMGRVNPSGKLAETFPLRLEDTPSYGNFSTDDLDVLYKESIFVGYRYYDRKAMPVAYEFGYGRSYTTFAYSDLEVHADHVAFTLENTGSVDGSEIAQLYVGLPDSRIPRALRELRGFRKVFLLAGEKRRVSIPLTRDSFTYYDVVDKAFEVEEGEYEIGIGASSRDIRLKGSLHVDGTTTPHVRGDIDDFESLFEGPLPLVKNTGKVDMDTMLKDALKTPGGREMLSPLADAIDRDFPGDSEHDRAFRQMCYELPIRGLWMAVPGGVKVGETVERINAINEGKR